MEGDWSTAVMQWGRKNASLMVPSSDWEIKFITTSFQHHGNLKGVWINCYDAQVEGDWNCNEGGTNPTDYLEWEPDQPDDEKHLTDQDYGFMITRDYKNNPDILGIAVTCMQCTRCSLCASVPVKPDVVNPLRMCKVFWSLCVSLSLRPHPRCRTDTEVAWRRQCLERKDIHIKPSLLLLFGCHMFLILK